MRDWNSYRKKGTRCRYMHPQTVTYRICLIEFVTNNTSAIIVDKNFRSIFNGNLDVEQRLNKISLSCFHCIHNSRTKLWLCSFAVFVLNSFMDTVYWSLHAPVLPFPSQPIYSIENLYLFMYFEASINHSLPYTIYTHIDDGCIRYRHLCMKILLTNETSMT